MRLSTEQQNQIQEITQAQLGADILVSVFGSRVDDTRKGGDVDLFIESPHHVSLMQRAALKLELEQTLSLPVDLLVSRRGQPLSPFQALAKADALPISKSTT